MTVIRGNLGFLSTFHHIEINRLEKVALLTKVWHEAFSDQFHSHSLYQQQHIGTKYQKMPRAHFEKKEKCSTRFARPPASLESPMDLIKTAKEWISVPVCALCNSAAAHQVVVQRSLSTLERRRHENSIGGNGRAIAAKMPIYLSF